MMKPYMIFSQYAGPEDGAGLVFAHSHREARSVGWQYFNGEIVNEYIDVGASLLRQHDFLLEEADLVKLANDEPHGIYPNYCNKCERWGQSRIGSDDLCYGCRHEKLSDLAEEGAMVA
jgi:hypothetical protein